DLTPAEVGTLIDEQCHTQDIVSTLIDLAARGYLKITEKKTDQFLFFSKMDFEFSKLKDASPDDGLRGYEQLFLDALFPAPRDTRLLSDLKYDFAQNYLSDIRDQIYDSLVSRGYFKQNPETVRHMYYAVAGLVILAGIMALILATPWGVGLLLSGFVIAMCAHAMPARTAKGSQALRESLGFRRFVDLAEKDRIAVLAKDDPTIFGRLLPYAVVLGVADQWAEKFKDLLAAPPTWYEPYGYGTPDYTFYPRGFVHELGGAM